MSCAFLRAWRRPNCLIQILLPGLSSAATSGKTLVAAAAAAWCSVVLASAACAVELALSGTVPLRTALPAMVAVHALIGVGEAAITCLVVASVLKVRPDLVPGKAGCA